MGADPVEPPDGDAFVFPSATGEPWPLHDWQNWRRCSFTSAARAVGLADVVPYDLRHSFASLLIAEGRLSVVDIAAQLGHTPTMTLKTYSASDPIMSRACCLP